MNYVVGYAFSPDRKDVVLIWKNRPEWQRGKLNGIGGKIEKGEMPFEAMAREFEEETGKFLPELSWELFAITRGPCLEDSDNWEVYYFRTVGHIYDCESKTDESVMIIPVNQVMSYPQVTHNQWLLPMALYAEKGRVYTITERQCQN